MHHILKAFKSMGIRKHVIYTYAIYILLFAAADSFIAFLMPLIAQDRIKSLFIVGLVLASSSVWDVVADILLGTTIKTRSYFKLAVVACFLMAYLLTGNLIFSTVAFIIISMAIWGFYFEIADFSLYKFVNKYTDATNEGFLFGMLQQAKSVGYFLGPIIAGAVVLIDTKVAILTGLFINLTALAVLFTIKHKSEDISISLNQRFKKVSVKRELEIWKRLAKVAIPIILIFFSYGILQGSVASFLPIMLEGKENIKPYAGFVVAFYSLAALLFAGFFGKLADKYGRKLILSIGIFVSGLGLLFLGYATTPIIALSLTFFVGFGVSMFLPSLQSEVEDLCRKDIKEENEILGETNAVWNIGFVTGTIVIGWVIERTGSFGLAYSTCGMVLLAALAIYVVFPHTAKPKV